MSVWGASLKDTGAGPVQTLARVRLEDNNLSVFAVFLSKAACKSLCLEMGFLLNLFYVKEDGIILFHVAIIFTVLFKHFVVNSNKTSCLILQWFFNTKLLLVNIGPPYDGTQH